MKKMRMKKITQRQYEMLEKVAVRSAMESKENPGELYGSSMFATQSMTTLATLVKRGLVKKETSRKTVRNFQSGSGSCPGGYSLYSLTKEGARYLFERAKAVENRPFRIRVVHRLVAQGVQEQTAWELAEEG